ncbi:5'-adenylylsulfate reductase-like 5 [Heracleum sosnowskyi]|uniref:5'-adenylylsulfate reductase-like 5 n=1 Tax=Heracleum sosnowskyi TaxID=360622 RepID=A0AAD8J4T8_9APIA|nr:5'-adenylylsulfate reductase-like 5 [Heracleum sosnowskyi]
MSKYISIHLIFYILISTFSSLIDATSFSTCPLQSTLFLHTLRSQSPLSFIPTPPLQVGGDFLETGFNSKDVNTYTSVLFYASWCPFSNDVLPNFEVLSSMFPQMSHVAVEESSVMPSILSRYGIHSFPTILIVKQASKVHLHGRKDLHSLLRFYMKTTGLEPMHYVAVDEPTSLRCNREFVMQTWFGSSPTEILRREPYLVLSLLFLCLVGFTYTFPRVVSHFKALWVSYGPHLNLEIFGETSQILGCVLEMIDVNRIWTKLKLCQTRRFISGAKNARVWASSLASVSLGKTTSCPSS